MALLREIEVSLATGVRTAIARPRHTLLIASGFVIAGITLAVMLTIPAGLRRIAGRSGLPDVVVVLPGGTLSETGGTFKTELAAIVESMPGIAHQQGGKALVAPQFVVDTRLRRTDGTTATVLVRGVTPVFWHVVGASAVVTSGQRFSAGKNTLISGTAAARSFVSIDTGATVSIHSTPWHVSGEFQANGGFWESQIWTDMAALQSNFHAQGRLSCLWVKLTSPAAFDAFSKALHDDPRTQGLQAMRQRDYYATQSLFLQDFIATAAQVIAVVLGLGAIVAIINALGMALDARRHDLAILRAIGFRRGALAVALVVEVLVIGAVCAVFAILFAWLTVNGREVGSSTFDSAIQFRLHVDSRVFWGTCVYLLALGFLGSLWPVTHAVRAPLTTTLQNELAS